MEKLEWMNEMKKNRNELIDIGDYDWRESRDSTEAAVLTRKFFLAQLFNKEVIPQDDDEEIE